VWVTSGLENVFRDAAMPANAHTGIDLLAARGETESAQIVASASGGCLDSVRAEPSALAGDGGRGLGPSAVQVNWVGYVRLTRNSDSTPDAELLRRAPDDFPDPLLDDTSVTVCAGASHPLLVRAAVPRAAAPGVYRGTVSLRNGGTLLRAVPISVEVLPVTLPEIPSLSVTNWFSARAIAQQHHVPEWSEEHWRLLRAYADDMRAHGQTMFETDLELIGGRRGPDGSLSFDYGLFDRWVRLFRAAGLRDIELMHVGRRTEPWAWTNPFEAAPRRVPVRGAGGDDTTDVSLDTFLAALQRHLVEQGWVDDAVLHVADEPIPENSESWRALSRRVHAAAPRLKRIEAIQVPDLGRDLEIWVVEEKRLDWWYDGYRARQRAGGMELWLYTSWLPQGAYPNRLIDYPLLKTRLLPWVAARYGATGFLHWGLNQWPQNVDPVDPNKGLFAPGDDFIVYPGRAGPRSSLRWEAFRDGVEDYALFDLWRRRDATAAESVLRTVVPSFTTYPRDPAALLAARRKALLALAQR